MPSRKFFRDMGIASLVAGVILLGVARVTPAVKKLLP